MVRGLYGRRDARTGYGANRWLKSYRVDNRLRYRQGYLNSPLEARSFTMARRVPNQLGILWKAYKGRQLTRYYNMVRNNPLAYARRPIINPYRKYYKKK